jgi:cysteinyl-tRNA synthetase
MKVYNTLSGRKEEFVALGGEVRMYVCGITPYDVCHIGHAMSYIIFDVVRRYLEFKGYRVKHVQNFTDVDDKIIARANELGIPPQELAKRFIDEYFEQMDTLNVKRAHIYPKATEEIPTIIEVISGLVQKGHAYEAKGDVYFRVQSKTDYGKLSHRSLDGMMAGARIEVEEAKEHPLDFALWKAAKPGEPCWPSPWGPGRPGWHIECSAMSIKYLGNSLDIHGGGQDLIFPHHENEIAQSESLTGVIFVRYWLHNGLLQLGQDKMSKSVGNLITVNDALARYSPDVIRLFVLNSHYRSPITYSEEELEAMEKAAERLRFVAWAPGGTQEPNIQPQARPARDFRYMHSSRDHSPSYKQKFIEAMDDDFSTPKAVAVLFDFARHINREREEGLDVHKEQETFRELAGVLGLTLKETEKEELARAIPPIELIELLISVREELRAGGNWALADKIRSRLGVLGIVLEDTAQGTVWHCRKP